MVFYLAIVGVCVTEVASDGADIPLARRPARPGVDLGASLVSFDALGVKVPPSHALAGIVDRKGQDCFKQSSPMRTTGPAVWLDRLDERAGPC